MAGETEASREALLHRALADDSRRRIIEALHGEPGGLGVDDLAAALGLHANTVRWHLGVLADAGVVSGRRAARATPGRPRTIYTLSPDAAPARDEFRLLASVLTAAIARDADAAERSKVAGWSWGRYLAPRRSPLAPPADEETRAELTSLLAEQGFAPERDGDEIRLRRCPYLELAEQHPDVVCSVHEGLIAGALDELGSDLDVELTPFVRPDLCVARLIRSG